MKARSARTGSVFFPFAITSLIWGSSWLVILGQLGSVPAAWSLSYRFFVAAAGMFLLARVKAISLKVGLEGMIFALWLGLTLFVLNYYLVYLAEEFLTSGIVALLYALLLIPNSLLARAFFGEPLSGRFLAGSALALAGVALLLLHEYRVSQVAADKVLLGIILSFAGIMVCSISNVMQGAQIARRLPMAALLAWGMLFGAVMDAAVALIFHGPPVFDSRPSYWAGLIYLALAASVATFLLYFRLIQVIGAGPASYVNLVVPVLAMLLSTLFEGYRWSALPAIGAALSLAGMAIAMRTRIIP